MSQKCLYRAHRRPSPGRRLAAKRMTWPLVPSAPNQIQVKFCELLGCFARRVAVGESPSPGNAVCCSALVRCCRFLDAGNHDLIFGCRQPRSNAALRGPASEKRQGTESRREMAANPLPMALWGLIVAALLVIGSIPFFVGLAVAMPVLGHATWHLYRYGRTGSQSARGLPAGAGRASASFGHRFHFRAVPDPLVG